MKKSCNENLSDKIDEQKTHEKNENMENRYFKGNKKAKYSSNTKNADSPLKNKNNIIDNKSFSSSINFFKEIEKDDNSRCENKLKLLNNNNSPKVNNNNNDNIDSQKENKCTIF
jgi:hypothetical protein